jgi:hypothetical protein
VRATDEGTPSRQDEEILTVRVDRNLLNPVMTVQQYSRQILEIQTVSQPLVTVQATDRDKFVSQYPGIIKHTLFLEIFVLFSIFKETRNVILLQQ